MSHRMARFVLGFLCFTTCVLAADITGIWVGQQQGRLGQAEDVAFRFKLNGQVLTGTMFGDEFDIPILEGSLSGDQVRFKVTTTNYYSGGKLTFTYTGVMKGAEIELVRERVRTPEDKGTNRPAGNQTLKLKRLG
jgi:hypothetical protein